MAPTRITIGRTGDFLTVADAKEAAGQRAWERARDVAVRFATEPTSAVGAKLLAIIGGRSNIGDPRQPDWLPNLPAAHRVVVLQELQQLVASWHHLSGRHTDGSRNDAVKAAQSTAAALRLAADQAGPRRGELLAKASLAEREAADAAAEGRRQEAAWLARAQARIDAGRARALSRRRAEARSEAAAKASTPATDDLVDVQPGMLYKAAGPLAIKATVADRVKASIADAVKAALAPAEAALTQLDRRLGLEERRVAAEVAARPPVGAGQRRTEADGMRARAAEYRAMASVPGMAMSDVAKLERAADALERQAG